MKRLAAYMSRGYTSAFAITAPDAPAKARPHGEISFDWAPILGLSQ